MGRAGPPRAGPRYSDDRTELTMQVVEQTSRTARKKGLTLRSGDQKGSPRWDRESKKGAQNDVGGGHELPRRPY